MYNENEVYLGKSEIEGGNAMKTVFQRKAITEPALFTPVDTTRKIEGFPEICVSTFSENIIKKFASMKNVEKIAELYTANGAMPVYKMRYKNQEIAFYLSRVGAPACVSGFEEIVAMGAKKFVLFGSCGVLDDEKVKDHIVIPVSAIRDEGTSYHYIAPSEEIDMEDHAIYVLEDVLNACGYSYVKGKTWTSDGIYRETVPVIQERREEGCLVVEMECASMLAVSKYRKIPFVQFLYGADNLSSEKWEMRDLELYGLTEAEKYMLLAFEIGLVL